MSSRLPLLVRLPLLAWLLVVWLALWGEVSVANLLSGLAVGSALLVVFPNPSLSWGGPLRPMRVVIFHAYFLFKVCQATAIVAWEVVTPGSRIREGIIGVAITADSDAVVTVVANAITLTPGTLTVEVGENPPTLFVHVLHLHDVEEVRMEVRRLEWLALQAYGSPEARAEVVSPRRRVRSPEPTRSVEGPHRRRGAPETWETDDDPGESS